MRVRVGLLILLSCGAALGCSSTGGTPGGTGGGSPTGGAGGGGAAGSPGVESLVIQPDRGTYTTPDGVSLMVPAGAVQTATTVTVTTDPSAIPANGQITILSSTTPSAVAVSAAFVVGIEAPQAPLSSAASLTIPFDPAKLPAGTSSATVFCVGKPQGSSDFMLMATLPIDGSHVSVMTLLAQAYVIIAAQVPLSP
jgi:hypothetical protein